MLENTYENALKFWENSKHPTMEGVIDIIVDYAAQFLEPKEPIKVCGTCVVDPLVFNPTCAYCFKYSNYKEKVN